MYKVCIKCKCEDWKKDQIFIKTQDKEHKTMNTKQGTQDKEQKRAGTQDKEQKRAGTHHK